MASDCADDRIHAGVFNDGVRSQSTRNIADLLKSALDCKWMQSATSDVGTSVGTSVRAEVSVGEAWLALLWAMVEVVQKRCALSSMEPTLVYTVRASGPYLMPTIV